MIADEHKWFDQEVSILAGPRGLTLQHISNTRQAAEFLLYNWPEQRGKKHLAARKACMAVLEGLKDARSALGIHRRRRRGGHSLRRAAKALQPKVAFPVLCVCTQPAGRQT